MTFWEVLGTAPPSIDGRSRPPLAGGGLDTHPMVGGRAYPLEPFFMPNPDGQERERKIYNPNLPN